MVLDQDLIEQMQKGSLEALGGLYDRHHHAVYRTALAITGEVDTANDLLQDVFLRLFRFADRIDSSRPLEPWLYRMTTNLAYTWVKRNRRWFQPLEDLVDWISGGEDNVPHILYERKDEWNQVQRAVSALPLQQRVVVVLYYLNDLSIQEISDILNIPTGTVKSRLHYGRNLLKKQLGLTGRFLPDFTYERP